MGEVLQGAPPSHRMVLDGGSGLFLLAALAGVLAQELARLRTIEKFDLMQSQLVLLAVGRLVLGSHLVFQLEDTDIIWPTIVTIGSIVVLPDVVEVRLLGVFSVSEMRPLGRLKYRAGAKLVRFLIGCLTVHFAHLIAMPIARRITISMAMLNIRSIVQLVLVVTSRQTGSSPSSDEPLISCLVRCHIVRIHLQGCDTVHLLGHSCRAIEVNILQCFVVLVLRYQ